MSQPFPLSAFGSLADGQPVAAIQGRLVKLFDAKSGTSSAGEWTLQNGEIEADGGTIPICFKDRPALDKTMRNRTILLTASNAKGMSGIYCWDDNRNGTTVRKVKVTASATLDIIDGASQQPASQQSTPPAQQSSPTQQATNQPQTHAQQPPKQTDDFQAARATINQIANLHLLCMLAVERYEAPTFKTLTGQDMSEPQRQAAVASLFIKADREGLTRYMPVVNAAKDPRFQPHGS